MVQAIQEEAPVPAVIPAAVIPELTVLLQEATILLPGATVLLPEATVLLPEVTVLLPKGIAHLQKATTLPQKVAVLHQKETVLLQEVRVPQAEAEPLVPEPIPAQANVLPLLLLRAAKKQAAHPAKARVRAAPAEFNHPI